MYWWRHIFRHRFHFQDWEKSVAKKLISIPEKFSYPLFQSSSQPNLGHHLVHHTAGTYCRMTDWCGSNQSSLDCPIPISQDSHLIRLISSLFSLPSVRKLARVNYVLNNLKETNQTSVNLKTNVDTNGNSQQFWQKLKKACGWQQLSMQYQWWSNIEGFLYFRLPVIWNLNSYTFKGKLVNPLKGIFFAYGS